MPAREPIRVAAPVAAKLLTELRIVYFGTLNAAVDDSIEALVHVVNGASLGQYGVERCRLDLYTLLPQGAGGPYQRWASERVRFHPWVSQAEAQAILLGADLLLLPFSFRADQRHLTERSFPSKAADYLAAARPILVIAPPDSTVALYATAQGFAEVVCAPDASQIAAAIGRIAADGEHRGRLASAARATFDQHHDLFQQQRELVADLQQLCR